ncbi:MAG: hypothetical protein ACQESR_07385 [Planctomycetota bacterium]
MGRCPTQAVLPLVGLAAEKVIRDPYKQARGTLVATNVPISGTSPRVSRTFQPLPRRPLAPESVDPRGGSYDSR